MNPSEIFEAAKAAAQTESNASEARQVTWFPCGFASVIITPARGPFVNYLKSIRVGGPNYGGGYRISSYDLSNQSVRWTQSMNVKEDATRAAVKVLRENGINARCESRMD